MASARRPLGPGMARDAARNVGEGVGERVSVAFALPRSASLLQAARADRGSRTPSSSLSVVEAGAPVELAWAPFGRVGAAPLDSAPRTAAGCPRSARLGEAASEKGSETEWATLARVRARATPGRVLFGCSDGARAPASGMAAHGAHGADGRRSRSATESGRESAKTPRLSCGASLCSRHCLSSSASIGKVDDDKPRSCDPSGESRAKRRASASRRAAWSAKAAACSRLRKMESKRPAAARSNGMILSGARPALCARARCLG